MARKASVRPQKKQVARVGAHAQMVACYSGRSQVLQERDEVKSVLVGDGVNRGDAQKMKA